MHPFREDAHRPAVRPRTAECARRLTRTFLSAVAPRDPAEVDAALIVVSELVANSIRHAGGVTGFELWAGPGTMTVCVADASPAPPRPRPSQPWEPGGFGWPLVRELAEDVRVRTGPDGKAVYAVLPMSH
ncbi:ATP-binding protein [Streptomyces sp. NPDC052701]|uniref:ATP-binding protein n=1 Tax=Streptomyces sp. NPDC052701 TaxID=3155533 RepID=UPI003447EB91